MIPHLTMVDLQFLKMALFHSYIIDLVGVIKPPLIIPNDYFP